jgi:hypothetical protein
MQKQYGMPIPLQAGRHSGNAVVDADRRTDIEIDETDFHVLTVTC